jgi:flagellar motor switch protein FliN/FliY
VSDEALTMSRDFFAKFGEAYVSGLRPRVRSKVTGDGPAIESSDPSALAEEMKDGALLARTIWGEDGAQATGCFLWIGQVTCLLGESDARPMAALDGPEIEALNANLRLSVEEGGDPTPPLDWAGLELIRADELEALLKEFGLPREFERARFDVKVGKDAFAFLFLMSTESQGGAEEAMTAPARSARKPVAAPSYDEGTPVSSANLEHLMNVRLPLTIRLGSLRMNLDELLQLTPGSILELDRRENEPLDVLSNGQVVARGEVVAVDDRFGLRITEIGPPSERIRTL